MSIKSDLDLSVAAHSLLEHPFYQAWSAGTLPVEALRTYAREYGLFIGMLPSAWERLQDHDTAQEEREHADLWRHFAAALETRVSDEAGVSEVRGLAGTASRLFSDPVTAAGALYAFELQQPATARSKLDGLKAHYSLPASTETYFELHTNNQHEAAKLLQRIQALPSGEQQRAVQACSEMASALWEALTGIYGANKSAEC